VSSSRACSSTRIPAENPWIHSCPGVCVLHVDIASPKGLSELFLLRGWPYIIITTTTTIFRHVLLEIGGGALQVFPQQPDPHILANFSFANANGMGGTIQALPDQWIEPRIPPRLAMGCPKSHPHRSAINAPCIAIHCVCCSPSIIVISIWIAGLGESNEMTKVVRSQPGWPSMRPPALARIRSS
jgi:hypothetical protein